ncbi:MAG: pseudouridine synthase [Lachnospiraceae bacterium]|nr:pseudouridine synthase [Lachnospiraceae bacterium]
MDKVRINKYLSEVGYCSRRQADALIEAGKIMVNGHQVVNGEKVDDSDEIVIEGQKLNARAGDILPVFLVFNKPRGVVCSSEGQGSVTVEEYLKYPQRVFSVGRLDKESEGLLILTNQGDVAQRISKARFNHEKEYVVTVDRPVTEEFLEKMRAGVHILGTVTRPCRAWKTGTKSFHIVLTQGLNRQIRRMCDECGCHVTKLKRIRVMNIKLGDLTTGAYRDFTEEELKELMKILGK